MNPVCLVTGAGGQLGNALCARLNEDFDIVASFRSTPPLINSQLKWRAGAASDEGRVLCVQGDLTRREDICRLVEVAMARFGRIDAVVNSAADIAFHGKLIELWQSTPYAQSQLEINCIAPMNLVSAVHHYCWKDAPEDNAHWNRSVINVSSMSGVYAYPAAGQAIYAASKAALNMLTLYLSLELAGYSVRVNGICPGRFTGQPATESVVLEIERLLKGDETGSIITNL